MSGNIQGALAALEETAANDPAFRAALNTYEGGGVVATATGKVLDLMVDDIEARYGVDIEFNPGDTDGDINIHPGDVPSLTDITRGNATYL